MDDAARTAAHLWRLTTAWECLDVVAVQRQLRALDALAAETGSARHGFFAASRRAMHALRLLTPFAGRAVLNAGAVTFHGVADAQDLAAYRRRLTDIDADLEEAESWSDQGRLARLLHDTVHTGASHQISYRSRAEIFAMLAGYDLVEPGLTDMIKWRPDPDAGEDPLGGDVTRYSGYAAVGRRS